eukprot:gene5473-5876_t
MRHNSDDEGNHDNRLDDVTQKEQDEEEEEQIFFCRFENNKLLVDLLIHLSLDTYKDFECYIEATSEVLMFSVIGRGKNTQSRITLPAQLFDEYSCSHENITFVVKLSSLLDCLRLFGSQETITTSISYTSVESILKISLEESGILTICEINCLYVEEFDSIQQSLMLAFRNTEEECQIIIKSDALKESLVDILDAPWIETSEMEVSNLPQYLKVIARGSVGKSEVLIPRASDAFISFNCIRSITVSYNVKALILGMKALNLGKETYLRINTEGILCLQHQIESEKGENVYYDFLLLPDLSPDN